MAVSFSGFVNGANQLGSSLAGMLWSIPSAVVSGFKSFVSRKKTVAGTVKEQQLEQALAPQSRIDNWALQWAEASLGTKLGVLISVHVVFSVLGLAFGAMGLFAITSAAVLLGMHWLLVSHHDARVAHTEFLLNQHDALEEGITEDLESLRKDLVDFVNEQAIEAQAVLKNLDDDVESLRSASGTLTEQLAKVSQANAELVQEKQQLHDTLEEVAHHTTQLKRGVLEGREATRTLRDTSDQLGDEVDVLARTHQKVQQSAQALKKASEDLTKSTGVEQETYDWSALFVDPHKYNAQNTQTAEFIETYDTRARKRKENIIQTDNVLLEEEVLQSHRLGQEATSAELQKLAHKQLQSVDIEHTQSKERHVSEVVERIDQEDGAHRKKLEHVKALKEAAVLRRTQLEQDTPQQKQNEAVKGFSHQFFMAQINKEMEARKQKRDQVRARLEKAKAYLETRHFQVLEKKEDASIRSPSANTSEQLSGPELVRQVQQDLSVRAENREKYRLRLVAARAVLNQRKEKSHNKEGDLEMDTNERLGF